jgi:hypothetical protein
VGKLYRSDRRRNEIIFDIKLYWNQGSIGSNRRIDEDRAILKINRPAGIETVN